MNDIGYPFFKNMSVRNTNSLWKSVQLEKIEKHLKTKASIMLNLYVVGKKLSKCMQTPLKVGLRQTLVPNLLPSQKWIEQKWLEKKWLEQCPDKFKLVYYRRYVDGIFVLFKSRDHIAKFMDYLNKCHPDMKFSFEEENNGNLSILDVEVSQKGNQFATTIYHKPTYSGVYTHFDSFFTYHIQIQHDLHFGFQIFFNLFQLD